MEYLYLEVFIYTKYALSNVKKIILNLRPVLLLSLLLLLLLLLIILLSSSALTRPLLTFLYDYDAYSSMII